MSKEDRDKWDRRYAEGAYADRPEPSRWLQDVVPTLNIRATGRRPRALDLACGAGRNGRYLASIGYSVDGIDISRIGLARARAAAGRDGLHQGTGAGSLVFHEHDIENGLPEGLAPTYDLIIIFRYRNPELMQSLAERVEPGGHVLIELHMETDADVAGPSSNRFRVRPGELVDAVPGLSVMALTEGLVQDPDGKQVALARLHAQKPKVI